MVAPRSFELRLVVVRGGVHQDHLHLLEDRGRVQAAGNRSRAREEAPDIPRPTLSERKGQKPDELSPVNDSKLTRITAKVYYFNMPKRGILLWF